MKVKSTEDIKILAARKEDLPAIKALLESVNLPLQGVEAHFDNFILLKKEDVLRGTVGLEIYNDKALLRSLAVAGAHQGQGFGQKLYFAIIEKAREHGIRVIYLLTETAEKLFAKQGFEKISRNSVDTEVKESIEFRSACPEGASCMRLRL